MASASTAEAAKSSPDLVKQMRQHEVAIAELKCLPSSRTVYHKNGNIFFKTSLERVTALEQRQVDAVKATLEKSNLPRVG